MGLRARRRCSSSPRTSWRCSSARVCAPEKATPPSEDEGAPGAHGGRRGKLTKGATGGFARLVPDLRLHGRAIETVFELMGAQRERYHLQPRMDSSAEPIAFNASPEGRAAEYS